VVQISRIQQRRGRKLAGSGFPQLASGEFGWAIDTQELYIGNGSVSEGAPYVGNTQILTEHVNILDFAGTYVYSRDNSNFPPIQTGASPNTPVEKSIQQRLDERVSISSFISSEDIESGDYTAAFQRAIDQLFLNATKAISTTRVVIFIEPGEYVISDELRIPPYVHLVGAGIDSTIIKQTSSNALFRMVDGNSTSGNYTSFESMNHLQRPRQIHIQGLTLQTEAQQPIVLLDNTDSTVFERVRFVGTFVNGANPIDTISVKQSAVWARSASGIFRPDNVQFYSCIFENTGYGFYSASDHDNIGFINCKFYQLYDAINVGGDQFGAVNTKVVGCHFDLIDRHGFYVKLGYGNSSIGNKYMNVGNDNNGYASATYPIIKFDTENNFSTDDYFERNTKMKDQSLFGIRPFISNVKTPGRVDDRTSYRKILDENVITPLEFFRFPVSESSTFIIDYVIDKTTQGTAVRTGKLHITVDLLSNQTNIEDDYTYTGNSNVENISFTVSLEDFDGDSDNETVVLKITNPTGNGTGTMNYSYYCMNK
jgi:Pectate lyase superfamily protein